MEKCEAFLKDNSLKCTKARLNILKLIIGSEESISADYIYQKCTYGGINVDLSTVYRTLELFEKKGIVEKFDIGKGKYNYLFKGNTHKHVISCKVCEKKIEIDCPMPQFKEIIKDKTGFVLIDEDIKFNGICEECVRKHRKK